MIRENYTVPSEITQRMIDLLTEHNLPVNIIVGESMFDYFGLEHQKIICEFEDENYHAFAWIVDKSIISYVKDVVKENENLLDDIAVASVMRILSGELGVSFEKGGTDGKS